MTAVSNASGTQLVTRGVLYVVSEGLPRLDGPGSEPVSFNPGCLALACQGSEMTAAVVLERHDDAPDQPHPADESWTPAGTGTWDLTSGRLALTNLEGLLDWLPDIGLAAGTWHVQVSTTGGAAARELEDTLLENDDLADALVAGPERWRVQLWR